MKRNEGFSLVELIVVIAILAILSTAAIMGVGMLGGWRMNECVSLLDGGLKETRTEALAKQAAYLTVSQDAQGDYYLQVTNHQKEKLAGANITIVYVTDMSPDEVEITPERPLVLSYDRASGAFLPMQEWDEDSGTYDEVQTGEGSSAAYVYCTEIRVRAGEKKSSTIKLVKSTGKHTVE